MTPAAGRGAPDRVTWRQVAAFRLSRHHLSNRAPARALVPVVRAMGGAQAQILSAAQLSLWARIHDLRLAELQAAVGERALVKAWCMRGTLHLVPSADLAVFVRGCARRAERGLRWARGKGLAERAIEALIGATLNALDRPLTTRELVDRVGRLLGVPVRTVRWGGWGSDARIPGVAVGPLTFPARYLLHVAGARGIVCSGPAQANAPTFVRADAWIPRWHDVSTKDAERQLLRWYLRAFGPATPADFSAWTGISLSDVREIWAREAGEIVAVSVDGWQAAILDDDLRALKTAGSETPPVRLLPYFDSFLLGHKVRDHLVTARRQRRVYRTQGWIAPVVLVEGRVAGLWAHAREGNHLHVRVTRFAPFPRRVAAGIREEAERLAGFLGDHLAKVAIT